MTNKITRKWIEVILPNGWCYEIQRADIVIFPESERIHKMTVTSLQNIDQSNMKIEDLMGYMPKSKDFRVKKLKCSKWRALESISENSDGLFMVTWGLLNGSTLVLASVNNPTPVEFIKLFRKIALDGIYPVS